MRGEAFSGPTVVIMAKAPTLGTVKTRLAAEIGDVAALSFYRECLQRLEATVARDTRWTTIWLITPDFTIDDTTLWPMTGPRKSQGNGDLGERMTRPLARARQKAPVVLIGSDIPTITADHINNAFCALRQNSLVFGPSEDGGFWLVGASKPPSADLFNGVRWSSRHALRDVLDRTERGSSTKIDTLWDVDEGNGYARWKNLTSTYR